MALVAAKSCLSRLGSLTGPTSNLINNARVVTGIPFRIQAATLKATYGEKYPYEKPFPYWEKKYAGFNELFDPTIARYNENSKVILVEGNIAVGKNDFARRLAVNFDLKYIPSVYDDACFQVNGLDARDLNEMLTIDHHFYDLASFYSDPHPENGHIGRLQHFWYYDKFLTYAKGLLHVLSTGQGVVLTRSALSDIVYADVLKKFGYITRNYYRYFNELYTNTECELMRPHLVIYLDAPVDVIQKRIKERNDPKEVKSKLLTDAYIQAIDNTFKQKFLPQMRAKSEVIEIDWSVPSDDMDMEAIAEEMEELQLEPEDNEDPKFFEWGSKIDDDWIRLRKMYESDQTLYNLFHVVPPPDDCPEVVGSQYTLDNYKRVVDQHPCFKYQQGWAPELGHSTLLRW